jgi:hypothetical protein
MPRFRSVFKKPYRCSWLKAASQRSIFTVKAVPGTLGYGQPERSPPVGTLRYGRPTPETEAARHFEVRPIHPQKPRLPGTLRYGPGTLRYGIRHFEVRNPAL